MQNEALCQAQIKLEESLDRFVDFYEFAPVGYLTITDNGLVAELNLTCASLVGVDRRDILQYPFARFVRPEDADRWHLHFVSALNSDDKQNCELALVRGDGSQAHVRLDSLRFLKNDQPPTLRVVLTDITERKQAEEQLRRSEAKHGKMIANISDVIIIINKDGANTYRSPNIERLLGRTPEKLIGISAWDNVHPDDIASTQELFRELIKTPNATAVKEFRYRRKNGDFGWASISVINLLHDPDIQGLLGHYHDISERKQAEMEIRKLNEELEGRVLART